MLMIRFQRVGKKNQPSFRVVLTEKHRGPRKKYLEELGFYNPRKKTVQLKSERILYWLSKGAQSSPTCHNLFIKEGIISGAKIKKGKITISPKESKKAQEPQGGATIDPVRNLTRSND
ncbi:MAG: 30S ribosomal protein S16 [bacterium]|nr:30S ribosomal protein S16 [bacterium]